MAKIFEADGTQLALFDAVSEQPELKRSLTDSVSELRSEKFRAIDRFLHGGKSDAIACVNKYRAGNRKNNYYYRLSYRVGRKIKHCHIPGGNTNAKLANHRATQLQMMLDRGANLTELMSALADYRGVK